MKIVTPAEIRNLGLANDGAGRTEDREKEKRDHGEPKPGDFYWHEDTPPMPLGRGFEVYAWYEDLSRPKQHGKTARRSNSQPGFPSEE
jgi:hypothetical protein